MNKADVSADGYVSRSQAIQKKRQTTNTINSDRASVTSNIIEANVANLIDDTAEAKEEDTIEDNVIEANVKNIIDDNKSDISEESVSKPVDSKPKVEEYSYDSVFPSLPSSNKNFTDNNVWNQLSSARRMTNNTTQVFHVPVEERKYRDVANSFGTNETNKKCHEIADRLGVKVEICCSKDSALHIVVSGLEEKVSVFERRIAHVMHSKVVVGIESIRYVMELSVFSA